MTNPTLITTPFAENGDKNIIPESVGANPQNATMQAGFPPITQQKISEGGIPPERNDFNGILNLYGQHIVHLNKGLPYEFDQAFADAIGGYPLNARLMLDNGDIVRSTVANNVTNPNVDMTGWLLANSASAILDKSGISQQEVNDLTAHLDTYLKKMNILPSEDISTVLNQVKSDGVKKLHVKSREYIVNSLIEFTDDFEFVNETGTVFNFGDTGGFYASGSHTQITTLASDIVKNQSQSFDVADASQIQKGDWLVIYCTDDFSYSPYRNYYRKGEFVEVASVSGNTVKFFGRAYDNYLTSENIVILKVNPINFKFNYLKTVSTDNNPNVPLVIDYARNFETGYFENKGGKFAGLRLRRCFNFNIAINSAKNNAPANTLNYGIQISNCQNYNYFGGSNNSTRHAVAIGGDGDLGCVPCRNGYVSGAILHSETDTSGADMHGNVERTVYDHCTTNYATFGAGDNEYSNCDIYEREGQGCVLIAKPRGGEFKLTNNTYYTKTPLNSWSLVHGIIEKQLHEDLTVKLDGGCINGVGGASAGIVTIRQSNALNEALTKKVNVHITGGVSCDFDALRHWAWVEDGTIGRYTVPIGYIIVDDVVNTKDTANPYLIYPSQSTLATNVKTRQMLQQGVVSVTSAVNNTATRANVINLKYKYSKAPNVIVSVGNLVGSASWDATFFNEDTNVEPLRTPTPVNSLVAIDQVRPAVLWNKKVVTPKTFNLYWESGIREI
ncbi:tail protein [Acinetobacter phage AP22]|uniref:Tail fiber protein n=1 Tax=Acinetobacter phage AP22 TaxID=1187128 RepID=I2GUG1_9CAUD|nr:tail protein [Acinetobacter phage AP22]CCH57762.1 hypothetical protein [Acinetobacter phage AP22]